MTFVVDLEMKAKILRVVFGVIKIGALLILLFFFVCSLDLLSSAFRLVGGRTTGNLVYQKTCYLSPFWPLFNKPL